MPNRNRAGRVTAVLALVAAGGVTFWANQASAALQFHDAAYGIAASGAAPIGATPSVSSTNGDVHTDAGSAQSSDGTISVGSATVRAGGGTAAAAVNGLNAFGGLVTASNATASCEQGRVTSSVSGTPAGSLGKKGTVSYGVQSTNSNGATTITAMRITITAGAGTEASTVNVASATCAPRQDSPGATPTPTPTGKPTLAPTGKQPTTAPTRAATPTPDHPSASGTASAPTPKPQTTHVPVTG